MTTPSEVETLEKLALAQNNRLYGPVDFQRPNDLNRAFRELPQADIQALIKKGLFFQLSATQGNVTEAGCEVLKDAREKAAHRAVVDYLTADAQAQGLVVELTGTLAGPDEAFRVTSPKSGVTLTMNRAELALFTVEEKLVKAGTIR